MLALRRVSNSTIPSDLVATTAGYHQRREVRRGQVVKIGDLSGRYDGNAQQFSNSYAYLEDILNASDPGNMRYRIASIPDPDLGPPARIEPNDVVDSFPNIYIHWIDAQKSNPIIRQSVIQHVWKTLKDDPRKDVLAVFDQFRLPLIAGDRLESRRVNKMKYHQCWTHISQCRGIEDLKGSARIRWIKDLFIECSPQIMNDALRELPEQQVNTSHLKEMYDSVFERFTNWHPLLIMKPESWVGLIGFIEMDIRNFERDGDELVCKLLEEFPDLKSDDAWNTLLSHLRTKIENEFKPKQPGLLNKASVAISDVVNHYTMVNLYSKRDLHFIVNVGYPERRSFIDGVKASLRDAMNVSADFVNTMVKSFNPYGPDGDPTTRGFYDH